MNRKEIKIEQCKNFIIKTFENLPEPANGIETSWFWQMAEKTGLFEKDTCCSPMSMALKDLADVNSIFNDDDEYVFSVFTLK